MNPEQVTEFLTQVIQPRFTTVEGVGDAQILGGREFAMRVWLDPIRLAARNVTAGDVLTAIRASNFLSAPGKTENEFVAYAIQTQTTLQTPEFFGALPVRAERRRDRAAARRGAKSNSAPRTTTSRAPSTARKARSSASSPRPAPTRSTRRRSGASCRRSRASCRRA